MKEITDCLFKSDKVACNFAIFRLISEVIDCEIDFSAISHDAFFLSFLSAFRYPFIYLVLEVFIFYSFFSCYLRFPLFLPLFFISFLSFFVLSFLALFIPGFLVILHEC